MGIRKTANGVFGTIKNAVSGSTEKTGELGNSALSAEGYLAVYKINGESRVRTLERPTAQLLPQTSGEYLSFCFTLNNNSPSDIEVKKIYAIIGGRDRYDWGSFRLSAGDSVPMHIYHQNMEKYGPGIYKAELFVNDSFVGRRFFTFSRDWNRELTIIPSEKLIKNHLPTGRSPYLCFHPSFPNLNGEIQELAIDFKADFLPRGTYIALSNWWLNMKEYEKKYASVDTDLKVNGYCGFQRWQDDTMTSIMSLWDVYCTDLDGNKTTFSPRMIYPFEGTEKNRFTGEGCGMGYHPRYAWEAGHPYRVLLQQTASEKTGNTVITMWVCDLESCVWTKLVAYDMGLKNVMIRNCSTFLENYLIEYSAQLRSAEYYNIRYYDHKTGKWNTVKKGRFGTSYNYRGSWTSGAEGGAFHVVTSGIENLWQHDEEWKEISVDFAEEGSPIF